MAGNEHGQLRANAIYAELVNDDGEAVMSATLEHVLSAIRDRNYTVEGVTVRKSTQRCVECSEVLLDNYNYENEKYQNEVNNPIYQNEAGHVPDPKFGPIPKPKTQIDYEEVAKMIKEGPKEMLGKPEYAVIPWDAMEYIVRVFEYGASEKKYKKPFTYKTGITYSKLVSAAFRHLVEWFYKRNEIDEESGCHHLAHMCANAMMLLTMLDKEQFDNRPKK